MFVLMNYSLVYPGQNVTRAHPMTESVVMTWLAVQADSASLEGRLACLCAIGNIARHQEGESQMGIQLHNSREGRSNVRVHHLFSDLTWPTSQLFEPIGR